MSDRKTFLKQIGLSASLTFIPGFDLFPKSDTENFKLTKILPKQLKKGDTIGLVTPSGIITEEKLKEIVSKVENLGYKTYYKPSILSQFGYLAGTDEERAEELMHMFENKDVDAILCARGGYGAIRMLGLLDYDKIKANPKVFIGYSDITAIINAIYNKTGLVAFHGPVGTSTFNEYSTESFNEILTKPKEKYKYPYEREKESESDAEFDFYTITSGKAEGELIGGNLSVIASMIGSAFELDFEGKIVYLEEVDEKTYSIDRMLTHLIQASNINKATGIVLGIFKGGNKNELPAFSLKELLIQLIQPLGIPSVYGFPFGHVENKMTIPNGINARFNADKKTLKLLEKTIFSS
jgi:muramoyltetrapeptide carboxypeptidase